MWQDCVVAAEQKKSLLGLFAMIEDGLESSRWEITRPQTVNRDASCHRLNFIAEETQTRGPHQLAQRQQRGSRE